MIHWCLMVLAAGWAATEQETLYGDATLQQWQERLGHLDPADRRNAPSVPALIEIIEDDALASDVRRPFAMTLGRMGEVARDAIPVLVAQIERRHELDKPTYSWAARALGLYGVHARPAVPVLVDLLFDEEIPQGARTLPIEALARVGTSHPEVMPALIRLLQYEGQDTSKVNEAEASVFRELAAEALAFIGPEADLAAPLLVRSVRNREETRAVRRKAIVALGAMGGRAALAVPALMETLEFEEAEPLRVVASEALGKIGAAALPLLERYLRHPDPQVRCYAARGIAQMGAQARPAQRALRDGLSDSDPDVRLALCQSLGALEADAAVYMPVLIELLSSDARQVRMQAMRALTSQKDKTGRYRTQLEELARHADVAVRAVARKTLQQLDRSSDQ